jgi:C1A family cysteine protease
MNVVSTQSNRNSKKKNTDVLPATFDYSTRVSATNSSASILRPVRDQGQCGSCYAFAMITLIEAQYVFQYGRAANMSEQQIVDCSTKDFGCAGGYFDATFAYLKSYNWYMNSASQYPYTAVAASNCSAKQAAGWSMKDLVYRHLPSGNASAMQQALITYGPLWISIYIGSDCSGVKPAACPVQPSAAAKIMNTFQSYTGGIYRADGCVTSADNNNHAMVIVGFGYDATLKMDYWKVRNSWGEGWGEDGYVRIQRGVNMCNVESDAFFLAKPMV